MQNLRYAFRALFKKPGFTAIALVTLALGIGANTAIFSVMDAVLLKPLPYPDPDRLLMVWEKPPGFPRNSVAAANFLDWKSQNHVFEQIAARSATSFNLSGEEQPEKVSALRVSSNYFDLLGVQPFAGRTFQPDEEQPGKDRVVILSHRLWQRRFGADPHLLGNTITLDGDKYTVVGILKPDSSFDRDGVYIYAPLAFDASRINRRSHWLTVLARLKTDVTIEQAQSDMTAIAAAIGEQFPDTNGGWGVTLDRLRDRIISPDLRQMVLILFGAVALVLLIACANLANLMLARAVGRRQEIAIRAALGASRWRLARQLITESLVLSVLGGALGIVLGYWLIDALTALMPPSTLPAEARVSIDHRVLLFALGISLLTGLIFGLVPAWQASKADLNGGLKEESRGSSGAGRRVLSRLLIVSEVALALLLLIGSGLLIRSLLGLQRVELGFRPANLLTMHVTLPNTKYKSDEQVAAFYNEALRRLAALPGVERAGLATDLPLVGWSYGMFFAVEGRADEDLSRRPAAHEQIINPEYFRALSIPIVRGRSFTDQDTATAPSVVIINDTLARRYFAGDDPIGKRLLDDAKPPKPYEIVGVAGDVKVYGLGDKAPDENAEIYLPFAQTPTRSTYLVMHTTGTSLQMADAARKEILALDKDQPITNVQSMEQVIAGTLSDERFNTALLGLFAMLAVALAAVGIYGVISYTVSQQTREIGIRMALGAQKSDVLKLVVRQGMPVVLIGVALGVGAALALTRVLASLLVKVSVTDPLTFIIAPLILSGIALLACYLPARRATRVDPMIALRYQ